VWRRFNRDRRCNRDRELPSAKKASVCKGEHGLFGSRLSPAGDRGDLARHDRLRILFAQMKVLRQHQGRRLLATLPQTQPNALLDFFEYVVLHVCLNLEGNCDCERNIIVRA